MITIPETLWHQLLDEFARHPRDVERIAYLDGVRWTDRAGVEHGVVTTVTIPNAVLTAGNYRVSAENIAQAGRHFAPNALVRLIQVHTHGNDWVDHSETDDTKAYSRRAGSLSIVLPNHARAFPAPAEGGVHRREAGRWRRLTPHETEAAVRVVPSDLNFRTSRRRWNWRNLPWTK